MKTCKRCNESKPLSDFYKEKRSPDGLYARCKSCHIKQVNGEIAPIKYRNPSVNSKNRKAKRPFIGPVKPKNVNKYIYKYYDRSPTYRQYGLTHQEFQDLYDSSKGLCAICGTSEEDNGRALAIDHCHDTLKVRGLLCDRCNHGLGHFKDNPDFLNAAIEYLKSHI